MKTKIYKIKGKIKYRVNNFFQFRLEHTREAEKEEK